MQKLCQTNEDFYERPVCSRKSKQILTISYSSKRPKKYVFFSECVSYNGMTKESVS